MKRYAIVRVEQQCPFTYEKQDKRAFLNRCLISTYQCKDCYGDTKEQLEKKVATAILRNEVKSYKKYYGITPTRIITRDAEAQCLKVAKEIVEFLGVEE